MNVNLDFSSLESSKNINNLKNKLNSIFKLYNDCSINVQFKNNYLTINKTDLNCKYTILDNNFLSISKNDHYLFDNELFSPYFGTGQSFNTISSLNYESNESLIDDIIKLIFYVFKANKNEIFI